MSFIFFLGRFHVLVLHLPITLLFVVVLLEWVSRREKYVHLRGALPFLWAAAAISAAVTVALGYMHFAEGGFTGPSALAHRFLGTSVAVLATAAWALRKFAASIFHRIQLVVGLALVALVTVTGHFGGNLTHGDTFLVEYAPEPMRRLMGFEAARAPVTDPAQADPYVDVVRPIFAQRCFGCHNDDKQRGGLNLANYATVMKGGKDGVVVTAGAPDKSELYRRISLPHEDKDFMPADGKTPLTEQQTAIIHWWIQSGAKSGVRLSEMKVPREVEPLIAAQLGIGGAAPGSAAEPDAEAKSADASLLARLEKAGFAVHQRSMSDTALIVRPAKFGAVISAEQLAELPAAAGQIVELSLQRGGVTDSGVAAIGKLTELTHLRLDGNKLTDAGVAKLGTLAKLQYLNLYGNEAISDASIERIAALPSLTELYLWGTAVTPAGVERLAKLRPKVRVDDGDAEVRNARR